MSCGSECGRCGKAFLTEEDENAKDPDWWCFACTRDVVGRLCPGCRCELPACTSWCDACWEAVPYREKCRHVEVDMVRACREELLRREREERPSAVSSLAEARCSPEVRSLASTVGRRPSPSEPNEIVRFALEYLLSMPFHDVTWRQELSYQFGDGFSDELGAWLRAAGFDVEGFGKLRLSQVSVKARELKEGMP